MIKKIAISGRDLMFLLYLGLVLLVIAYFLGEGDVMSFFSSIKLLFPISESVEAIKQFIISGWTEGSLGTTKSGEVYEDIVMDHFPRSLYVILTAFFLSVTLGISKGIFDYRYKNTYLNVLGTGVTSLVNSLPDFLLIIALQWIILFNFNFIDVFGHDQWFNFIFPSILVALYPMMYFARITFATLSAEDGEMYIQFARSKGLTQRVVIKKHILKKCFHSILQHLGVVMTYIVSNLLIVEWLMEYKGAAWRMMTSIKRLDVSKPAYAAFKGYPEIGLIVEISFCFVVILVLTQIVSIIWKNKYQVEKRNVLSQIVKVIVQYLFIWFFVLFIICNIKV
ncbi:ABC transporter permease subunit [Fredinandcohnia sp. 179-A 10B2 NHS]|uniref:ABC transporter permease subunit n=1 Tax=Fredinandcohnia sp. 179-A 10B2 NHS TaxID=3235176 RepID=UPI0039A171B4